MSYNLQPGVCLAQSQTSLLLSIPAPRSSFHQGWFPLCRTGWTRLHFWPFAFPSFKKSRIVLLGLKGGISPRLGCVLPFSSCSVALSFPSVDIRRQHLSPHAHKPLNSGSFLYLFGIIYSLFDSFNKPHSGYMLLAARCFFFCVAPFSGDIWVGMMNLSLYTSRVQIKYKLVCIKSERTVFSVLFYSLVQLAKLLLFSIFPFSIFIIIIILCVFCVIFGCMTEQFPFADLYLILSCLVLFAAIKPLIWSSVHRMHQMFLMLLFSCSSHQL